MAISPTIPPIPPIPHTLRLCRLTHASVCIHAYLPDTTHTFTPTCTQSIFFSRIGCTACYTTAAIPYLALIRPIEPLLARRLALGKLVKVDCHIASPRSSHHPIVVLRRPPSDKHRTIYLLTVT
ncbi:hypothetical protein HD806DRAFT_511942 [Xylariaceae sp. AK1471]|nr:hypothetical protein HD806DRAFT_511942 [Xylariaceae sp. AK1471]